MNSFEKSLVDQIDQWSRRLDDATDDSVVARIVMEMTDIVRGLKAGNPIPRKEYHNPYPTFC